MLHRRRLQLFCQRQDLKPGSILGQPRIDPTKNIIEKTSSKKHHRKNIIRKTSSKKKHHRKKHHPKNIIEKKNIIGRNTFRCFLLELRKAMEEER